MRSQLPRTYYAFFAHFRHPHRIQQLAAAPLLSGEPVLLVAPTAAGKTEAFLAPLVERYFTALKEGRQHLLLVCPTRALVNDAARRLQAPLKRCGLSLRRRTGDASEDPASQTAALWLTTPEGLDSLLCRHARWLGKTAAIVMDEVHLLLGTPRGTQMLCLLQRLQAVCQALQVPPPQRVAATATAVHPQELAQLFLGPTAVVLSEPAQRPVRLHYHEWFDYPTLGKELASLADARKVLLFASSRAEAEEAAVQLRGRPPFGDRVMVHHSSLSTRLRLDAEKGFVQQGCALMCATTTMEVGVDVGDIDWVVLLHPPEDALSFVQRCGRSGRRQGRAQALACLRGPAEKMRYQYYLERGSHALPELGPVLQFDSVVVQQALSLLWQNPRKLVTGAALHQRLTPALAMRWEVGELEELLQRLGQRSLVEPRSDGYGPTNRLEAMVRRGQIHANIGSASQKQVEIRDAFDGRVLGKVDADPRGRVPSRLRLGGRSHQLRQDRRQQGLVAAPWGGAPLENSVGSFSPAAPVSLESSQDFGAWIGLGPRCLIQGPQGNLLGHFLGTCWGELLQRHLQQNYAGSVFYADPFVVAWKGSFVDEVWSREALWGCLQKFSSQIQRLLPTGRWHSALPKARQRQEVLRLLHWDWVQQVWLQAPWRAVQEHQSESLRRLLQSQRAELPVAGFFPIEAEDL